MPPGQPSLVVYIEQLGPVWPMVFLGMGISLILAITARRYVVPAHILAVFGWMFYGSALLIGEVFSEPPTSVVTGAIAVGSQESTSASCKPTMTRGRSDASKV